MAGLIYMAISSLDGYIEDASGAFDWAAADDEVHGFVIGLARPAGTYNVRLDLELLDERRFGNGTVFLRYRTGQG